MARFMKNMTIAFLAGITAAAVVSNGEACSSLVVGKDASATGYAFFGRSADDAACSGTYVEVFPRGSYRAGSCLPNPYLKQKYGEEGKYSYLFSHDSYKFLATPITPYSVELLKSDPLVYQTAGINEKGVSVSATNTTYLRKEAEVKGNGYTKKGIDESFAALILLAEADSARDGVLRMGRIVERDGVGDEVGFILMVGDKKEAWVFETLGHRRWVASRVPDDKFLVVANDCVTDYVDLTDKEHYLGTADIKQFAIDQGFAIYGPKGSGHEKDVNLAASYGGGVNDGLYETHRRWRGYNLFAPSQKIAIKTRQDDIYPMFMKPDHKISPLDEMNFHRDRYEGTIFDLSTRKQAPLFSNGFEGSDAYDARKKVVRSLGVTNSSSVHILELNDYPAEIGGRIWYCLAAPENSIFLPYYGNITDTHPWCKTYVDGNLVPGDEERYPTPRYQADSAFSIFQDLGKIGRKSRTLYGNVIKAYWQSQEKRLMSEQPAVEQQILSLYAKDPVQSARYATNYSMQLQQWAMNRAGLMRRDLLQHIAMAPKEKFVVPADNQPYVNLEPRTDLREDLNEGLVMERVFGLGNGGAKEDSSPIVDYSVWKSVLRASEPQTLPDSAASVQMKLSHQANFSRLQYTFELMGKDYEAFGSDLNRVRQEFRLFTGGKELIGPKGLLTAVEAQQKNVVQIFGDEKRATLVVNLYVYDGAGEPLYQSGMLIVPDGQKDHKTNLSVYTAGKEMK